MSELKPVPCAKCGERPEVQDKRIRFAVICECETPCNYAIGDSIGFLDHIENEEAAQIAFDAINVNELKRTAIESWNKEQEVLRLTAIATKHATRADELYEAGQDVMFVLNTFKKDLDQGFITKDKEFAVSILENFAAVLDKSRIEAEEGL